MLLYLQELSLAAGAGLWPEAPQLLLPQQLQLLGVGLQGDISLLSFTRHSGRNMVLMSLTLTQWQLYCPNISLIRELKVEITNW